MNCERCGNATDTHTLSYFNVQAICPDCERRERAHPHYEKAKREEMRACIDGNYNFPGIGLPPELDMGPLTYEVERYTIEAGNGWPRRDRYRIKWNNPDRLPKSVLDFNYATRDAAAKDAAQIAERTNDNNE